MKDQLPTTQSRDAIDTIFRAFCVGATLGIIIGIALTASIFIAHMAHHDRMFHTPKQEVRAN
jgi:Mg/Co/Ni transporter MgtE